MTNKIAFTICTLNRMGMALTVGHSFIQHNTDYQFFICVADKIEGRIKKEDFAPFSIIDLTDTPFFQEEIFNPILLSYTNRFCYACKSYFAYYLNKKMNASLFIYLDSDILVLNNFSDAELCLQNKSFIITPEIGQSYEALHQNNIPDRDIVYAEYCLTAGGGGVYNTGFFAWKQSDTANHILYWWKERLCRWSIHFIFKGDQDWFDLIPIYFPEDMHIFRHDGYNVLRTNFVEREISERNNIFYANEQPIIFVHFCGYNYQQPQRYCRYDNYFTQFENQASKKILQLYYNTLTQYEYLKYTHFKFSLFRKKTLSSRFKRNKIIKLFLRKVAFKK